MSESEREKLFKSRDFNSEILCSVQKVRQKLQVDSK